MKIRSSILEEELIAKVARVIQQAHKHKKDVNITLNHPLNKRIVINIEPEKEKKYTYIILYHRGAFKVLCLHPEEALLDAIQNTFDAKDIASKCIKSIKTHYKKEKDKGFYRLDYSHDNGPLDNSRFKRTGG